MYSTRSELIQGIFNSVSNDEQLNRLLNVCDKYTSIIISLDTKNKEVAMNRVLLAKENGDLLQSDVDLIETHFNQFLKPKL